MDMRKGAAVKGDILETVKSFRFTPGKGLRGPEPFGCMNTGVAPVIMRSKATGNLTRKQREYIKNLQREIAVWMNDSIRPC